MQILLADLSDSDEKAEFEAQILADTNFDHFSAYQLVRFAKFAAQKNEAILVQSAVNFFAQNFGESEQRLEMSGIGIATLIGAKKYEEALALSEKMIEEFPEEIATAQIYKLSGDALRLSGKFEAAIERYNKLIRTRAWRGNLTPESLFWTADCFNSLGETEKAFAFYQRVYVLYENHTKWAAKAYAEVVIVCKNLVVRRTLKKRGTKWFQNQKSQKQQKEKKRQRNYQKSTKIEAI